MSRISLARNFSDLFGEIKGVKYFAIFPFPNIFSYASNILLDYVKQGIENNIEENKSLIISQAVLHIFSCEIGLKALLLKEDISYGKTHKLNDLFELLPEQMKENIRNLTKEKFKIEFHMDCNFDDQLSQISNMFIELRYHFEAEASKEIIVGFIVAFNSSILHFTGSHK